VEKLAYKNANRIILTSDVSKGFVIRTFAIDIEKIKVIPNYIDTDLFKPLVYRKRQEKNFVYRPTGEG
jgi:glycosyltransferase involved in cell wall biosynthesis